jgi:hypothetical protein
MIENVRQTGFWIYPEAQLHSVVLSALRFGVYSASNRPSSPVSRVPCRQHQLNDKGVIVEETSLRAIGGGSLKCGKRYVYPMATCQAGGQR